MKVKLHLAGSLSLLGKSEVEALLPENSLVTDLLDFLTKKYGAEFSEKISSPDKWLISINNQIHLLSSSGEIQLKNLDEIIILPQWFQIISGG